MNGNSKTIDCVDNKSDYYLCPLNIYYRKMIRKSQVAQWLL